MSAGPINRPCETCGAEQGFPCVGKRGQPRKAFHRARGARSSRIAIKPVANCESPIETKLAGAILGWIEAHYAAASLDVQAVIGPFRADILVTAHGQRLVVECDGREWHANSEIQVNRDKRRDRFLAIHGYAVMRFTGSEINRNCRSCADDVGMWINRAAHNAKGGNNND